MTELWIIDLRKGGETVDVCAAGAAAHGGVRGFRARFFVAQKMRDRAGIEDDGGGLVDAAFSIGSSRLALNTPRTESEQSEQKGFANLLKGVFGTFRNVLAHAPKISWGVDRTDAMDALTILSYIHRRLDEAVVVPRVTT